MLGVCKWADVYLLRILAPGGCLPLLQDDIHVYDHNIQISFSLKPFGQSKPDFRWNIVRKWGLQYIQMVNVT